MQKDKPDRKPSFYDKVALVVKDGASALAKFDEIECDAVKLLEEPIGI